MEIVKKIIIFGIIVGVGYGLLGYHFIFYGSQVKFLKKSTLTLKYTFYNIKGKEKQPEKILRIEELYNDGIGELMVEMGIISQERLEFIEQKLEEERYANY